MMDVAYGTRGYHDKYLLFKNKKDIESYLSHEIEPVGRLCAKDYVDYSQSSNQRNGTVMVSTDSLTIETPTTFTISVNDWLLSISDGKTWRVNRVTVNDDGQMKEFSTRARKVTILSLVSR